MSQRTMFANAATPQVSCSRRECQTSRKGMNLTPPMTGHHITQCPTLFDKNFDSPPDPDYCCHACGLKGDHFIHSCPKKLPKSVLKKKQAVMDDSNPNLSPLGSRRDVSSPSRNDPKGSSKRGNKKRNTSGHVRKRSDDVELVSKRRKRSYPDLNEDYNRGVPGQIPPQQRSELAFRMHPSQKGRLSPWDTVSLPLNSGF